MLNRWQSTIVDAQGNVQPLANLTVRLESDQSLAKLWASPNTSQPLPDGMVQADGNGYAYFYAQAGLYRIQSLDLNIDWRHVDIGAAVAQTIAQQALDNALPTYETLLDMQADTGQPVDTMARVVNDLDPDNNGFYLWDGAAWNRTSLQPASDADVQDRLRKDQNLADLDDAATARTNLGLGSAAVEDKSTFALSATKVEGGDGLAGGGDLSENRIITLSGQTKYDLDQLYAQVRRAEYGDGPYPVFDQVFGANARYLDPRITFARPGKSWRTVNGAIREYDVNEPVLTGDWWSLRPAETNQRVYSEDFSQSAWTKNGVTVSTVSDPGWDGVTPAFKLTPAESGSFRQLLQSTGAPDIESGTTYTEFYVVKPAGYNYFQLLGGGGTFGAFYINFDIATGTIAYDSGAVNVVDRGIIPLSNGWMLVYVTATATGSGSGGASMLSNNIIPDGTSVRGATWDADGTSGILMCAAMHNVGGLIPYIRTGSSVVTRPADNTSIQGDAFAGVFNPMEGAIILDASLAWIDQFPRFFQLRSSGVEFSVLMNVDGKLYTYSNSITTTIDASNWSGVPVKIGLGWSGGKISVWLNGIKKITDLSTASDFSTFTQMLIGQANAAAYKGAFQGRRLRIFRQRPSDAQMEAMTS